GNTASQYQTQQLIPASCDLSFLQSFFFELRSEVMCSSCDNITSNTTMETILPLHITKVWGNYLTNVPYQLKAVIVHEGTTISSGHYVCYLKRGERWYFSSDTTVRQSSHLEATSQEAYLLFYEKDEVEDMQEVTHISSMSFKVQNCQPQMPSMPLKRKKFPVKFCLPPGCYALKAEKPGIFKTATGSIPWKYSTLDAASISKAEGIAMAGVQISGNPRIKAWEPTDIEKLLPAKHKITTEPGQVSDDQARPFLASSGLTNDCRKANNSSCTNLKGKVQKQHYQADSDSDFESPKKRQKTDPCRESPL
ncbi:unnamed protein product, partial [Pocillopora meandrina]